MYNKCYQRQTVMLFLQNFVVGKQMAWRLKISQK